MALLCQGAYALTITDDFNRADTAASTNLSLAIGSNWINGNDTNGLARIFGNEVDITGVFGTALAKFTMLNTAIGTLNNGLGTNFTLSAIVKMDTTASTAQAGLIVNYIDVNNYYQFRYSGTGNVQFTRTVAGVVSATPLSVTAAFTPVQNRPYELTVSSADPYVFDVSVRDTVTDTIVYSKVGVTDANSNFKDGFGGVYATTGLAGFDNFSLTATTAPATQSTLSLFIISSLPIRNRVAFL